MKIKPFAFSFIVALFISFIFLMATFWIFYRYSGNTSSAKDAFSTTGSYFGAVSTLGAAVIAAYLFTDWRDEREYLNIKDQIDSSIRIIDEMDSDLDIFSKEHFNDIDALKKLFYQLYDVIQGIELNLGDISKYKELHLEVAKIFGEIWLNGDEYLSKEKRFTIMCYRGEIYQMKTTLIDSLNKKLNKP